MEQPTYKRTCRWEKCQSHFETEIKSKVYCTVVCQIKAGHDRHRLKRNEWSMNSYYRRKAQKLAEKESARKNGGSTL